MGAIVRSSILLAGASVLAFQSAALAQDADASSQPVTVLEPLFVTAGRTPVEAEKSGRAFTVITGEELEANQVRYVADALRQVPGFAVSRMGSVGGLTQVRVRGAESNHLLVMIDGVEASETTDGEFDFGSLLVDDIDRIEILRGPQSAFWGSNATAGVVNIITKRGERNGFKVSGRTEGGTDGTWLGGATLSGGGENYDLALSALHRRTGGFNVSDYGSEKDGDVNTTLNGRFTVDLTPDFIVDGTLRFVDRTSDTDAQDYNWGSPTYGEVLDTDDQNATREFLGSLGATYTALDGALVQKARFSGNDVFRRYFENDAVTSSSKGSRLTGLYQATYSFDTPAIFDARHFVTGGYEWEDETFLPSHLNERFDRETHSLVAEYRGEFADQVFLNAALRHDFNDAFEDATTYSVAGAWQIPGFGTRLHASVGTGVTNPGFFDQFGYVPSAFIGNPDLTPEKSFGWDIGVEQRFFDDRLTVAVTYFNQDLTDEITTDYSGPLPTVYNQTGISKRQGVEIAASLALFDGFTATATYTYTDATEQTFAGGPRVDEIRRPKHSGSLNAAYVFHENKARVFGELVFNAGNLDTDFATFTTVRLKDYAVVNLGGSYRFNEHFEAYARVENVFDTDYEEIFGYNTQGRAAFFGLRGTF